MSILGINLQHRNENNFEKLKKKRQPTFGHASDLLASNFLWEARLSHLLLDGSYTYSLNASRISYQLSEPP